MYSSNQIDASNFVHGVDLAFMVILGISLFFLVAITIIMIYFIIRYNSKRNPKATQIEGSTKLEIVWTVIPTILVLVMFYYGWAGWKPMTKAPKNSMNVKAIARMWSFRFEYNNGRIADTLYVPQDQAINLELEALDVIHSLYIPAFRVKEDMVPGKNKFMWFIPQKPGTYNLFCAEYCGLNHSYMTTAVKVLTREEYDRWYVEPPKVPTLTDSGEEIPGAKALEIIRKNGCNACHSSDGTKQVGPSYLGSFGKQQVVLTDGKEREVTVDEEYLKKAIYEPNADIVKGYNKGLMLSYKDLISEEELQTIIEYIKMLNE